MDLTRFIRQAQQAPTRRLRDDADFRRAASRMTVSALLRATPVVPDRPIHHPENDGFKREHEAAWTDFVDNLAGWERSAATLELPRDERVLVAGWHFPEAVAVFRSLQRRNALFLVFQDAPWFRSLKEAGCTLNFSERGAAVGLARQMSAGRVIVAALDHHQAGTRTEKAVLLGRAVETPSGVFELCSRNGYRMAFPAPRDGRVVIVEQTETQGKTPAELARQYNAWLEAEIRRAPARWLMWQALPPDFSPRRGDQPRPIS